MSVSISNYLANHSNWVAQVLKQWLDGVVLIEIDKVGFSTVNGSVCCTIDVFHSLSCSDLGKISTVLSDRFWTIFNSSEDGAISLYFYLMDDEL